MAESALPVAWRRFDTPPHLPSESTGASLAAPLSLQRFMSMDGEARVVRTISDGTVVMDFFGQISFGDVIAARSELAKDPGFTPGMSFLVDFTGARLNQVTEPQVRHLAHHGRSFTDGWGEYRTAIVASDDVAFGLSRMYEAVGDRPGLELKVFRDRRAAFDWLRDEGRHEDGEGPG